MRAQSSAAFRRVERISRRSLPAPNDWTLAINYVSPAFKTPSDLAIDSQGNAWVLSVPGGAAASTVSILNTNGITATFPQSGVTLAHLALDPYDDPWLTNNASSNVLELTSSGSHASSNPFTGGGIQGPEALAFDGSGNVWVVNNGPTVSKLSPNGAALSPSTGYSTGGPSGPSALALDTSGNIWVANSSGNSVSVLSNTGVSVPGSPYTSGGLNGPFALAIDSTGGAWIANHAGSSLSRLASDGSAITGSPFFGAGLNAPIDIALDGLDNVWLANSGSSSVSEFLSTGRAAVRCGWLWKLGAGESDSCRDRWLGKCVGRESGIVAGWIRHDHADHRRGGSCGYAGVGGGAE